MTTGSPDDLTARLSELREILRSELAAAVLLQNVQLDKVAGQRDIQADWLNKQNRLLQEEIDRRFAGVKEAAVTLKTLLDERFATQTKALDTAMTAQTKALETAMIAADKAVTAALTAAEKAVNKAEIAAEARFASVNEFRQQLNDQATSFVRREEVGVQLSAISEKLSLETGRNTKNISELDRRITGALSELELRLTSRLDLDQGGNIGQREQRTEYRVQRGEVNQGMIIAIMVISSLISIAGVVVAIVLHG